MDGDGGNDGGALGVLLGVLLIGLALIAVFGLALRSDLAALSHRLANPPGGTTWVEVLRQRHIIEPTDLILTDETEMIRFYVGRNDFVIRRTEYRRYFYPADDTPGCTKEACAFRDRAGELKKLGAKVYGVSPDDVASHVKFKGKYKLNFPLLADPEHKVAEQFGAWREKNMYGKKSMGIARSTFLIAPDGTIRRVWKSVKVDGHDEAVIEALKELAAAK